MEKILLDGSIPVNCYLIEKDNECYIVDPGFEKDRLTQFIDAKGLSVKGILLTHAHFDHIGALDAYEVPVYMHKEELDILGSEYNNGFVYYDEDMEYSIDRLKIVEVDDGSKLSLGDGFIQVIFTPGHTKGGVCYLFGDELYTGDTLFNQSVGRWDFPTGDQTVLRETVINLIESMDEDIKIYPAHGEPSTIGQEKVKNNFYLYWKTKGEFLD